MHSQGRLKGLRCAVAAGVIAVSVAPMPALHARKAPADAYFAHVAFGAGWSVVFALVNTGATTVNGTLSLRGQDGSPLNARIDGVVAPDFDLEPIPPGGVRRLVAEPLAATEPLQLGWAKYENIGGNVTVSATYQLKEDGVLTELVGVRSSPLATAATIPVYNDLAADRFVGFAVANPNASAISLRLTTVNENGVVQGGPVAPRQLSLPPHGQVAVFLHEILPARATFTGSIVLSGQGKQRPFVVAALLRSQNLLTAVPVIPE